jgi:hypothetical protein
MPKYVITFQSNKSYVPNEVIEIDSNEIYFDKTKAIKAMRDLAQAKCR